MKMTHSQNTIRIRIALITVAALMLVFAATPHVQAAGLPNCGLSGTTPCFEKVWVDGHQFKMTFINLNPPPTTAPTTNFYVVAPQTGTPQGAGPFSPFLHDHVTDTPTHEENHDDLDRRGNRTPCQDGKRTQADIGRPNKVSRKLRAPHTGRHGGRVHRQN